MERVSLKREVGLIGGFGIIIGSVIGSGIFISVKSVLSGTGSVGLSLVIWLVAGIFSGIDGLCNAELGTTYRKSGNIHAYLLEMFGSFPAFLYSFTFLFPSFSAIQSLAFAEYIAMAFAEECEPPRLFVKLLGLALLFLCAILNILSVKGAVRLEVFMTVIKLGLCLVIAVAGLYEITAGNTSNISGGFLGSEKSFGRIAVSLYSAMWAYSGLTLPIAIITSTVVITILYLLVNLSYLTVLGVDGIMTSNDAVATAWEKQLFSTAFIMSLGVALSVFGTSLCGYTMLGRILYVAGREGHMPEILSYVQVNYCTPIIALIVRTLLATVLVLHTDIITLINMTFLLNELFSVMVIVGLIVMRYRRPDLERPFKVPLIIPAISVVKSIFLFVVPIVDSPVWEHLYVMVFFAIGVLVYVPFVHYKIEVKVMRKIAFWIQIMANAAPTKYNLD